MDEALCWREAERAWRVAHGWLCRRRERRVGDRCCVRWVPSELSSGERVGVKLMEVAKDGK